MTDIDTSTYTLGKITMTIELDLENMPALPVRFSNNPLIATRATIRFGIVSNVMTFDRAGLTGVMPLKSGGPSKRIGSAAYGRIEDMPDPIKAVVAYAQAHLRSMLT
jgi:hypothetical protein